jgi:hypothetical protein
MRYVLAQSENIKWFLEFCLIFSTGWFIFWITSYFGLSHFTERTKIVMLSEDVQQILNNWLNFYKTEKQKKKKRNWRLYWTRSKTIDSQFGQTGVVGYIIKWKSKSSTRHDRKTIYLDLQIKLKVSVKILNKKNCKRRRHVSICFIEWHHDLIDLTARRYFFLKLICYFLNCICYN